MDSILTAAGAVAAALIAIIPALLSHHRKSEQHSRTVEEALERLQKHSEENYMAQLRLTLWSNDVPLVERINAGERYVALGGNGASKLKYDRIKREFEESGEL
jgi:hypothetical protein